MLRAGVEKLLELGVGDRRDRHPEGLRESDLVRRALVQVAVGELDTVSVTLGVAVLVTVRVHVLVPVFVRVAVGV